MWSRAFLLAATLAGACSGSAPPSNQAAAPAATQKAAPPPPAETALAGIPDVERQYYDVTGNSLFEIRRALNAARPRDPNDGEGVDAVSGWYFQWRWPLGADGACDLARTELSFSARIRMPRLVETPATPPAVRLRWRAYVAALEAHEANHIRHAWDARGRVLATVRASSCANANRDGEAVLAELVRGDVAYDQRTRHGRTEGAHFP